MSDIIFLPAMTRYQHKTEPCLHELNNAEDMTEFAETIIGSLSFVIVHGINPKDD